MNKSLAKMIRETRGSTEAKKSIKNIESKKLAFTLKRVRFDAGMTQEEVAKKMGVPQSKVARMEKTAATDFKMGDLSCYLNATGASMDMCLGKQLNIAQQLEFKAKQLHSIIANLEDLCADDEKMMKGALKSQLNAVEILLKGIEKHLPKKKTSVGSYTWSKKKELAAI
jgi:predicted XRE-type DNA-binding protein